MENYSKENVVHYPGSSVIASPNRLGVVDIVVPHGRTYNARNVTCSSY